MSRIIERLLVVSHTKHYYRDGQLVGWGPTVRELDYLSELFSEVVHVAVLYDGPAPTSAQPYRNNRLRFRPVSPSGGTGLTDKLSILGMYPDYARVIGEEMAAADAVHVRCPANISLLTQVMLITRDKPTYRWLKYAGNWRPDERGPLFYALERKWLAGGRHRGVVTVNGRWPNQPPHVVTFDNPSLTEEELQRGRLVASSKQLESPVELLYAGGLNEGKGVSRVLEVCRLLSLQGVPYRLQLLGDGPDRPHYEAWARDAGLSDVVFHGWIPRDQMYDYYAAARIILLPSRSEGWPKVLSEAMAYGVVPVASEVSSIPQILNETGAGIAIPAGDIEGQAAAITRFIDDPDSWKQASQAGVAAAERFSYQTYQQAVIDLFDRTWQVRPSGASDTGKRHREMAKLAATASP